MKFSSLSLDPRIIDAVKQCGYQALTEVQSEVIPLALLGEDVMACAQTGTGKTAAFTLPLLHLLSQALSEKTSLNDSHELDKPVVRVLVLTPTRELAIQVNQNIENYSQFLPFKTLAVYGGANINPQRKALSSGVDFVVATPGRLFDHIGQQHLDLSSVTHLVVDEADRMLDMGFVRDIEKVKRLLAVNHQTLFFSATYNAEVKLLAEKMLIKPHWVNVASTPTGEQISQEVYLVDKRRKTELLSELVGRNNWQQVLVFVSTKESADDLCRELTLDGIKNAVFHGDKTQGARNRALEDFKSGQLRVMVATDVAARGLDIESLPLVINIELPEAAEDYIHRIGRTGRAGQSGRAISFVSPQDEAMLAEIEAIILQTLPRVTLPGYEFGAPLPARYRENMSIEKPTKNARHSRRPRSSANGGPMNKNKPSNQTKGFKAKGKRK
ncbi:DEAD/DEAH box helicase [Shewanella surugensis]|uniref:DEAD/DEAH box helicase n=1 Tax=Shewanella surugensis TaxID=212020 RepID=A0ABT0LG94_9GAMM|nr:DEAD/DEAH box helicase [Shewanella surugensis]MCL1126680.1 DEAD/DEAH box helicase [Shewanella surugensis]